MPRQPKLTFVVPARNNRKIIGATLTSIAAQTTRDFECLVIDGLSTDGTREYIAQQYPWVQVLRKDTDSGPAASRSLGLLHSRSSFVALVDSDVQLQPDWAEKQLHLMEEHPRVGISGSRLLYRENPEILCASFGAMNRYGISRDGGQGEPVEAHLKMRRCIWCNTSAIMVRRELTETAGIFDDVMFAVYEDTDFGWRAAICGFDVVYNPDALATHDVHGTFDLQRQDGFLVYLLRRNRLRSLLVNYELSSILRYVLPYVGMSLVELILRPQRWPKLKALAWNLSRLPDTMRRRRMVQQRRKIKDAALWPLFEPGLRVPRGDALVRLQAASRKVRIERGNGLSVPR